MLFNHQVKKTPEGVECIANAAVEVVADVVKKHLTDADCTRNTCHKTAATDDMMHLVA